MKPGAFLRKGILLFAVIAPLVGTAIAVVLLWNRYVSWLDLALLGVFYAVSGFGITIGYHRMLTHRAFDAPAPVRAFWLILGSMALQGPANEWAATHLKHHAKADREGDPHSPVEGFVHAHLGWLFRDRMVLDGPYARPFKDDPVITFVSKTFLVWAVLGFVIPFLIGGWTGLLWGGFVRVFLVHHITWSVNSICHSFGTRPFETVDRSRNEPLVGLLGFGEGWHNNHHAFPQSAYHGLRWWQIDTGGMIVRAMSALRLIRNVHRPGPDEMRARRARKRGAGDASAVSFVPDR